MVRGRLRERTLQAENLSKLLNAGSGREWWNLIRDWTDPKRRPPRVSVTQLANDFHERLNPSPELPWDVDRNVTQLRDILSGLIPQVTMDHTPQRFFSRPFLLDEVESAKRHLARRNTKGSPGLDGVSYQTVLDIPNDILLRLFNSCIQSLDAPHSWLTTVLVGVLKQGKPATSPQSYRLVGLECCLLKALTLLIDRRIRAWAEENAVLPDSQNGFREGYRTHNNSFVLRTAIEKARAEGKALYVAFVDLKNAFPSTHLPTLWLKLFRYGVSGPLFDWLRMLYARMAYVMRDRSSLTAPFKSIIGVLTGDTASPVLWNVYFADLGAEMPDSSADVVLHHRCISHVEQADDVALFSTSLYALQQKLNGFLCWCKTNHMTISTSKSKWMIFGKGLDSPGQLCIGHDEIERVSEYKFVGVWFTSTMRDIFAKHFDEKVSKACRVACASFALDDFIGTLAPSEGRTLYMARVDPILTFASEVVLDIDEASVRKLTDVQHLYIRRLLGVGSRSVVATLFSETGFLPLRFRRVNLAIAYLVYLRRLPDMHYAHAALRESISLLRKGFSCWIADLNWVISHLPGSDVYETHVEDMDGGQLLSLQKGLVKRCDAHLQRVLNESVKCLMVRGRLDLDTKGRRIPVVRKMRHYLTLPVVPAHRNAFIAIMFSSHGLAVERLRWKERYRAPVPKEWRLCRFCRGDVEDETHALMVCRGHHQLVPIRDTMRSEVLAIAPLLPWLANPGDQLLALLHDKRLATPMAKFIYNILTVFYSTPMFVPAPYLYSPLLLTQA